MHPTLIEELFSGPVDIVGDVHGELVPLQQLLQALGYASDGAHPEGRRLVFVGDLTDRGPDSPGVVRLVRDFVRAGRAQCIVGNHELNILRDDLKPDNRWYFAAHQDLRDVPGDQRVADERRAAGIREFFASLPLALERDDLRVVHACWHEPAVAELRHKRGSVVEISQAFEDSLASEEPPAPGGFDLHAEDIPPPMLSDLAEANVRRQNDHPVKALTSGLEEPAPQPFLAGHKWRFEQRWPWWNDYRGPMVVIGHYWRSRYPEAFQGKGIDLFEGTEPESPLGARGSVMCVDYSIGKRAEERRRGVRRFKSALAAFRWPEQRLVFANT